MLGPGDGATDGLEVGLPATYVGGTDGEALGYDEGLLEGHGDGDPAT